MAEYNKEKLYFLQMNKDFFNSATIKILERMANGKEYVLFFLKLMCESTPWNGYLRMSEKKPYTPMTLAAVTNTDEEIVKSALRAFEELELIEYTDEKSIFIPQVERMTVSKTKGSIAKAEQRGTHGGHLSTIDIYRDRDIDRYIYIDREINKKESKVSKKSLNEKNNFENLNENDKAFIKMCIDSTELDGKQLTYAYFESQGKADLYDTYLEIIEESEDE